MPYSLIAAEIFSKNCCISDCTEPFTRADLDGSNVEHVPIISDGVSSLAIDSTASTMYWIFYGVNRANPDEIDEATEGEKIVADVSASGLVLDLHTGTIYWTEYDTGTIRRANLDGTEVKGILTGLDRPLYIRLYAGAELSESVQSYNDYRVSARPDAACASGRPRPARAQSSRSSGWLANPRYPRGPI